MKYSSLAQSVEHAAVNRSVVGSSPTGGVFFMPKSRNLIYSHHTQLKLLSPQKNPPKPDTSHQNVPHMHNFPAVRSSRTVFHKHPEDEFENAAPDF